MYIYVCTHKQKVVWVNRGSFEFLISEIRSIFSDFFYCAET